MLVKEAIEEIENLLNEKRFIQNITTSERHAIIMGKIALKRRLGLKPKNISDDGIERYVCAKCNNVMHRKKYYCDFCGQALDWGNKNDT